MIDGLTDFESAVLHLLLAVDSPIYATLRRQAACARLVRRQLSGVGFFCEFEVPEGVATTDVKDFHIGNVIAEVCGLRNGVDFVLFVRGGKLACLEGVTFDEPWPEKIDGFTLRVEPPLRAPE